MVKSVSQSRLAPKHEMFSRRRHLCALLEVGVEDKATEESSKRMRVQTCGLLHMAILQPCTRGPAIWLAWMSIHLAALPGVWRGTADAVPGGRGRD